MTIGYEYQIRASMSRLMEDASLDTKEKLEALRKRLFAVVPQEDREEDEDLGEAFDRLVGDLFDITLLPSIPDDDFREVMKDFYDFCETFRVQLAP